MSQPKELASYLEGKWVNGKGREVALVNPSTEETLATSKTDGLDFKGALAYAREGGAALRAMSFAARGELVRAMSKAIHGARDELIGLAVQNGGSTRSDAKFDIDGAWGTLAAYGDIGAELGDRTFLLDGDATQLGRSARLFGQHVYVPREGVAVHINAFNFPAWGLGEKAAVAILAGMPIVAKPATSTALVTHRIVELIANAGILPAGVLSLVCGSSGDMLDHVTGQDVVAFTGSSTTGALLRRGEGVVANSVRMNVEADSLNAAVLGPDVAEGSDVLNLFLADVVRDMTQKTGQKCTAIRRVYVPRDKAEMVLEHLRERLSGVRVGNPSLEDVTMGPLSTAQQLKDVRAGIGKLEANAKVVFGSATEVSPLLGAGEPGKGFFLSPVLLFNDSPASGDVAHLHEVFGPVATVMSYDGSAKSAAALVRAGHGGLVSSVYSDDKEFLKAFVLGIAPFHGRVTIGSSKIAAQAVPPGLVLPGLIHGGPGRAGGGEELGGKRGLAFYMQRVALQGDRALLEGICGK